MPESIDAFSSIATRESVYRDDELITPEPPHPETRVLPLMTHSAGGPALFPVPESSATQESLAEELSRIREKFLLFLGNNAPSIPETRRRICLDSFQWRLEQSDDRMDGTRAFRGAGPWEMVSIPHYAGPLGRFAALYRRTIVYDPAETGEARPWLCFKGADYRTQVCVNGNWIGEHTGFFAPFEFDLGEFLRPGENILLLRVENDYTTTGSIGDNPEVHGLRLQGDKIYAATGSGWDDPERGWHHCPPGMGIYQSVYLDYRPQCFISDLFVRLVPAVSVLDDASGPANIEAWIELTQSPLVPGAYSFEYSVYGQNFSATVLENIPFDPRTRRTIGMGDNLTEARLRGAGLLDEDMPLETSRGPQRYTLRFQVPDARYWNGATPWLYQLQVRLKDQEGRTVDAASSQFGLRTFKIDSESQPKHKIYLNGSEIRLRGANTMGHLQQCVIKGDWNQLIDDILLAKLCGMNFLRLTQRPVQKEIYEYCDRLGLMIQTDLPLFGALGRHLFHEAVRQAGEMERLVRNHPCVVVDSFINEPFPNGDNQPHRNLTRPELEDFFRAASRAVLWENPDRAIKAVDGDYDPPGPGLQDRHCYNLWYNGHGIEFGKLHAGWWMPVAPDSMFACGEFGAEGLDPPELMYRRYPAAWLPPSADELSGPWTPSAIVGSQTGAFHYMFFDTPNTLRRWCSESQSYQALALSLMTRAFRRENRMNSFAVHLFIDAFPAGWMKAIMDTERRPKPAYFAYREALSPLLADIRSDRSFWFSGEELSAEAWVCNDGPEVRNAVVAYRLEEDGHMIDGGWVPATIPGNWSTRQGLLRFTLPEVPSRHALKLRLAILSGGGNGVAPGTVLSHHAMEVHVFPKMLFKRRTGKGSARRSVVVLGSIDSGLRGLFADLGWDLFTFDKSCSKSFGVGAADSLLILVSDSREYTQQKAKVDLAVSDGAIAVFLPMTEGTYSIGQESIRVRYCAMNALHFVSRNTGHPMVADFEPRDFSFWFDEALGYISPLLTHSFTASGNWNPILCTGNVDDHGRWSPALAVAEAVHGRGVFRVCQISLEERIRANPPARLFAQYLFGELV